jgi:hypothetical protein
VVYDVPDFLMTRGPEISTNRRAGNPPLTSSDTAAKKKKS